MDGADAVTPFKKLQVVSRNLQWTFIENGTTQIKTANLSNISGYQHLTADDIFLDFKNAQIGYSNCSITLTNKTYDATKGILSCSFAVGDDSGAVASHRYIYLSFDLICV